MLKQNSTGSSSGSSETRRLIEMQTAGKAVFLRFRMEQRPCQELDNLVIFCLCFESWREAKPRSKQLISLKDEIPRKHNLQVVA